MSDVVDLTAERERRAQPRADMQLVTASDFQYGVAEPEGGPLIVVVRDGFGLAFTEREARQFAREIVETADIVRKQRIQAEEAPHATR